MGLGSREGPAWKREKTDWERDGVREICMDVWGQNGNKKKNRRSWE